MNHTFWSTVPGTSCNNSRKNGKFESLQVCLTLPRHSKSLYLFGHSPRLAHRPPDGFYPRDFPRLNVVCDPVFYDDLSSPFWLLSPL
ncbi:hypothetical protein TNCV_1952461 [Trichonephila clavipes]|nr:hypothetical protein TNCV_1952461 [Trichonephila clavipes]